MDPVTLAKAKGAAVLGLGVSGIAAAEGVSMTLIGGGAAVWNKTLQPLDAYLLAAEYDDTGRQSAVGVTKLHLAPGERIVTPVPRGHTRLFLCSAEWIPLTAPLDA